MTFHSIRLPLFRTHPCPLSTCREGYTFIELNAGGLFYTSIFVFWVPPLFEQSEKRGGQAVSPNQPVIFRFTARPINRTFSRSGNLPRFVFTIPFVNRVRFE